MAQKYYFDTCVLRDYYEGRVGRSGRPLGTNAARLIMKILHTKDLILYSDAVTTELRTAYGPDEVFEMFHTLTLIGVLKHVEMTSSDIDESNRLSVSRMVPRWDALHAIIARNNRAILVSPDRHFDMLRDITETKDPEELT